MPASGYLEIHSDSGTIYDDGGSTGNYSTRVNSTVTIYPSTPGAYVILSGNYFLEDCNKSKIYFYSGDTNTAQNITQYITYVCGVGCVAVRSNTVPLTIKFIADTETPTTGFEFNFRECLDIPFNINNISVTDTTAEIQWSEHDTTTNWIVEYNNSWFNIGGGTKIFTDTNYVKLDSLINCSSYYFYIYSACDTISNNCNYSYVPYNYFYTSNENSRAPSNLSFNTSCNEIEASWQENDTNIIWVSTAFNYYNYTTDSIISNIPYANFDSLFSGTYYNIKICPINTTNENCDCYYTGFYTNCCCPLPSNLYAIDVQANTATIGWDEDTNAQGWVVGYKINTYPDDSLIFTTVNTNQVILNNLTPVRPYEIRVYSLCDSLKSYCSKTINIITDISGIDNCITFTNLRDTNFAPYTGSYSNPNQNLGLIDYGYNDVRSRHTVHYDTTEVDPRTDSLLHTVPPGEEASVRLGNWLPGAEGESFTYAYDVDTNVFDLMYLRYAVVMENPGHTMQNQPRFTLEILNTNNTLIDPVCGYADFYASDSLGWNTVPNSTVIWKDWTLVGFDITPYHGQRILVRLTTRDCDEGGHYGYAYYNLKCGSKRLISSKCGDVDSNTFIAPIGFNYRWYSSANPALTLSTERILNALVDSTVNYHCLVSSTENPSCTFLYTAYGGYRYPLSQLNYTYTWQPCKYTINFNNLSTISANGINPAGTGERCETTKWVFTDGDTITTLNAVKTFSDTSEIKVRLISGIANDQCIDILDTIIKLNRPYSPLTIIGDSVLCYGDTSILGANHSGSHFWSTGDTTTTISITPLLDKIYSLELVDSLGCYNIDSIGVIVNPIDTTNIYAQICDNQIYTLNGFHTNIAGIHEQRLVSQYNCDSIVYLNLTVNPTYNDTLYVVFCQGNVYDSNGFNENETGFYTLSLQTIKGCDSIVNLSLIVNPTYHDTIYANICEGETYNLNGFNQNRTGFYTQELQTYLGCDSIVNLNLTVREKYYDTLYADICKGSVYNQNGFNEDTSGFFTHSFQSIYGCDSIINLSLNVHNPYFDTIIDTICKGNFYGYGFEADSSGTYTQLLKTVFGCDSILVLHLWVNPTYHDTIHAEIYSGNTYKLFGFSENKTGVYEQPLQTYLGCDSIIYLDLQVDKIVFPNAVTPNGDGINDVFEIHNLIKENAFPENELYIFTRQGKEIYYIKNIKSNSDFWNPNTTNSPEGTYFYRFLGKRPDKTLELNGSVEVLR